MKSLINKYQEELKKLNLECKVLKECNDKWNIQKCLQYNAVKSFALMTKQSIDMHKQLNEMMKVKE